METPPTDFELVRAGHKCEHCYKDSHNIEEIRLAAKNQCPSARIWLASIGWAASRLDHTVFPFETHTQFLLINGWVTLEIFELVTSSPASGKLLPGCTDSQATFATIQTWLEECLASHTDCARPLSGSSNRSLDGIRFLEIQEDENRLILLENTLPSEYACLSHCWGSGQDMYKTKQSNLKDHSEVGIDIDQLPRTFIEAVEICQRMNISYLWIDSLCIIQDSEEDWRCQAARMGDIYENSLITIAATSAENPTEGCFRNTRWSCLGEPLPGHPGVYIRDRPDYPYEFDLFSWPLLGRAWVFQELYLSPRVIHFGEEEVLWQCRCRCERESQPNIAWSVRNDMISSPDVLTSKNQLFQSWHQAVRFYSPRKLTNDKDRLPAIAAIASRFQDLRQNDQYLAGLWRSTLCLDLLWFSPYERRTQSLQDIIEQRLAIDYEAAHRMPTWSWASTSNEVHWHGSDEVLCNVEVLDIAYSIRGPSVSGEIQEAAITLRAPLMKLDTLLSLSDPQLHPHEGSSRRLVRDRQLWDNYGDGLGNSHVHSQLFVLPVSVKRELEHDNPYGQIALMVMETEKPGRYIRLGVVCFHFVGWYAIRNASWSNAVTSDMVEASWNYNTRLIKALEASDTPKQIVTLV